MASRERMALLAAAAVVAALLIGIGGLATTTQTASPSTTGASLPAAGGFDTLHERGLTGANVSVGVVDVTGFDTDAPALVERVRAARGFGTASITAENRRHGTAAATVVARTAPDADLYLATVGGIDGYAQAVAWLERQGVDVIVAPVSFYGRPGDGSGTVGRATTAATDDGVTVVAPSGNLAASQWRGRYDRETAANGSVDFGNGRTRTAIDGPTDVTVWLSWDRAHADEDYTVELYRTDTESPRLVARSQPYRADETPNERIVASVSPGRYALVIRGPAEPTGARLRLTSPTHEFADTVGQGSVVAPGTAPGALTVGAYDTGAGAVEPFSSRGPSADGRPAVDVVAPSRRFAALSEPGFVGSSAATPYVGGLVALMLDADPSLSPAHAELLVELTATDIRRPGVDFASGHGVVDPPAAAQAAANGTA